MPEKPKYPGIRVTANGNQLVSYHTETRITDAGVFYPITPSTEGGELYQQAYAEGKLNVFGQNTIAVEAEGEHAAQGGAIAHSVCGKRVVNFTSGQGVVYGVEQYYHAPGKCSTMVLEVGARALTKHALNVHCGHDDVYGALDTGWIIVFGKDAQQAADQALILRRVTELSLTPGMNVQDGFLTSHLERTFYKHESELMREYLGAPDDVIDCPTESQRVLFGPKRRRVPKMIDLTNPVLLGPVQNQEHYMQGVVARRNNFVEPILEFLEDAYELFGDLTGRYYGLITQYKTAGCRHGVRVARLGRGKHRSRRGLSARAPRRQGRLDPPQRVPAVPGGRRHQGAAGEAQRDHPRAHRRAHGRRQPDGTRHPDGAVQGPGNARPHAEAHLPAITPDQMPRLFDGVYGLGSRDFRPEHILGAYEFATGHAHAQGRQGRGGRRLVLRARHRSSLRSEGRRDAFPAARGSRRCTLPLHRRLGRHHHRQEPGRDPRRPERPALRPRQGRGRVGQSQGNHPRQRQPEIRLGKEGRADVLLHGRGSATYSRELRSAPRHRGAVLRSQGFHPHQSARRNPGRRLPDLGVG